MWERNFGEDKNPVLSFERDSKGSPGTRLLGGRSLGQMGWTREGNTKLCLQTSITYNDKRVHAGAPTALNGGESWETSAGTRAVLRKFGKVSWRERCAASGSGNRGWGNAHPGCLSRGLLVASWVRCSLGRPALCVLPSPISPPLSSPPCHPRAPSSTSTPPSSPSIISW